MLSLIASVVGLIPGLENLASSWHSSDLEAKVKMYMAKTGADRDMAVAIVQAQAQVQTRWWFVAVIPVLWALPFVAYVWKGVFFDNFLALIFGTCDARGNCILWGIPNTTPPLGGTFGVMLLMIVTFYFAAGRQQS
jgi:hypothetical protein